MTKYTIVFISTFLIFNLLSQVDSNVEIRHYERKLNFNKLNLPYDTYNSSIYRIVFPDSLYEDAQISIKKAFLEDIKTSLNANVVDGVYHSIVIYVRGRKRILAFEKLLKETLEIQNISKGLECLDYKNKTIELNYTKQSKRRATFKLIQSNCKT